jgi:riboflavin biosynthesis pyrimidine reductase
LAGEEKPDNALVLHKLASLFGMRRVMIGGGRVLNWSYVQDGLVDELSILMAPIADAAPDTPSLFEAREPLSRVQPHSFSLLEVTALEGGTVWLRYKVKEGKTQ